MTAAPITTLRAVAPTPAGLMWENPPQKTPVGAYAEIAEALRQNPNRWAVIKTFPVSESKRGWGFAGSIRSGKLLDFREGFEANARTVDGQVRVYVRFVGAERTGEAVSR